MRRFPAVLLCLGLAACSGGGLSSISLNPLDWFGARNRSANGSELSLAPARGYPERIDNRAFVPSVTSARITKEPAGVMIVATVRVPASGYRGVDFVERPDPATGTINVELRLLGPGGSGSRSVQVATFIDATRLARARSIMLIAAENSVVMRY